MRKTNELTKIKPIATIAVIVLLGAGCTSTVRPSIESANDHAPTTTEVQEPTKTPIAEAQGPVTTVIRSYLEAAGRQDVSATKALLSANYTEDIAAEFQANAASGWIYSEPNTGIESQTVSPDGHSATVKAQVVFRGGSTFMANEKTFSLVLEGNDWKISGIDPKPRQVGPGVSPL